MLISFGSPEGSGKFVDAETISHRSARAPTAASPQSLRPGDVSVHTASSPAFVTFSNIARDDAARPAATRPRAAVARGGPRRDRPPRADGAGGAARRHRRLQPARHGRPAGGARERAPRRRASRTCASAPRSASTAAPPSGASAIDVDLDEDGFAGDGRYVPLLGGARSHVRRARLDQLVRPHARSAPYAPSSSSDGHPAAATRCSCSAPRAARARRFGFFQAVQLLHRLIPDTVAVGELGPPSMEPVRFQHDPSLIFQRGRHRRHPDQAGERRPSAPR